MLRLNPDGSIPADNPFYRHPRLDPTGRSGRYGLRNPFKFAINRGGPAADPAHQRRRRAATWEEVNEGIARRQLRLARRRGHQRASRRTRIRFTPTTTVANGSCAITGGAFYAPGNGIFPGGYINDYFFADNCAGFIRRLDPATNTVTGFATGIAAPVDLKVGADGLPVLPGPRRRRDLSRGLRQPAAEITAHPATSSCRPGEAATFTVAASGTPPSPTSGSASRAPLAMSRRGSAAATRWHRRNSPTTAPASASTSPTPPGNLFSNEAVLTVTHQPAAGGGHHVRRPPVCSTPAGRPLRSAGTGHRPGRRRAPPAPSPGGWTSITTPTPTPSCRRPAASPTAAS